MLKFPYVNLLFPLLNHFLIHKEQSENFLA